MEQIAVPDGFFAVYQTPVMKRVQKRFKYHLERHSTMFYDEVAQNLNEGKYFPHPSNVNPEVRAGAICFTFEGTRFMVPLPHPHDPDRDIYICPAVDADAGTVVRAAHVFSEIFVTEYRRFFSGAIRQSKRLKG
ncbi:MAG: hypothetical protein JWL75_443, partial [Parcubacteria group bacterium]|nr:hypothetical protein [Parcubacteria group bacterium]